MLSRRGLKWRRKTTSRRDHNEASAGGCAHRAGHEKPRCCAHYWREASLRRLRDRHPVASCALDRQRYAGRAHMAARRDEVPQKQPRRECLWLVDGTCGRLRPRYRNHVRSYDFVEDHTHDGWKYRMLNVVDEFTDDAIAIRVKRKLNSLNVIDMLSELFLMRGVPGLMFRQRSRGCC